MNTPEEFAKLAATRERELQESCAILGIEEVHFLGYRDSGMRDTPENANPANFLNANFDEAVGRVVHLIRGARPDVLVTYDEGGGYGHPDHIAAHRVTTAAVTAAGDPKRYTEHGLAAWQTPKFYYSAIARSIFVRIAAEIRARGLPNPMDDAPYDMSVYFSPEESITTRVDVRPYIEQKRAAGRAHRTQIAEDDWFSTLSPELILDFQGTETFIRVRSLVPVPMPEDDLFAGLREND
jgi:LmbE family N-acetylglucosaminyl deacetylase